MSTTFTRHADRPFTADPVEEADVIIVGSGFAGLGLAMQLERDQNQSYLVLERADDVGGTWRDNTYPGVYCDVPSHLYSYSFRPNPDWSMVRSPGHEIYEYLQTAAREEGVLPQVRFGTTVLDAAWDEVSATWLVTTNKGTFRGRFFVPAMGLLSDSKVPEIPGMETFGGELFHSAAWDHDLPLTGKRVAIIGTGATAIQLVPELAEVAAELVVFQRSAAHVLPRRNRAYTPAERRMFARVPESRQGLRSAMFWFTESTFGERRRLPQSVAQVKAAVDSFREAEVPDQALRAALTPDYEIGCKRLLYSDDYYATFGRDHVSLETSALARIEGNTVIGASGNAYEVDVIVMATGFAAARPPFANIIRGREGVLLADHWATGMEAYQTITVSSFPNMFLLSAPSAATGHTSAVYTIEAQVQNVMEALDWVRANDCAVLEVRADAEAEFVDGVDRRGQGTVWTEGGCNSWYLDPGSGKLTLIWPDLAYRFADEISHFTPAAYVATPHRPRTDR